MHSLRADLVTNYNLVLLHLNEAPACGVLPKEKLVIACTGDAGNERDLPVRVTKPTEWLLVYAPSRPPYQEPIQLRPKRDQVRVP
jgi:hypothetical protein